MRVVIDLQGSQTGSRFRGIGRYTSSLVREILKQCKDIEFILLLNELFFENIQELRDEYSEFLPHEQILVWSGLGPVALADPANDKRRIFSEIMREAFIANLNPDVILNTSIIEGAGDNAVCTVKSHFDVPTICIIYDLIPLIYPDIYLNSDGITRWYHKKIDALRRSDFLLSISESSAKEAVDYLDFQGNRVSNISTASTPYFCVKIFSPEECLTLLTQLNIDRKFLLYVSAGDERKNHVALLDSFRKAKLHFGDKFSLVFAGSLTQDRIIYLEEYARSIGLDSGDLVITGSIDDRELLFLYNSCVASIFPSWHEGFGLPVLEAMQCGKAVITSNCSSLPEVVGIADAMFDPFDIDDMCDKIVSIMTDTEFRERLERHSIEQAKKFSWERSARHAILKIREFDRRFENKDISSDLDFNDDELIDDILKKVMINELFDDIKHEDVFNCIAANIPSRDFQKRIFVDISEFINHDSGTGIQRVVRSILREWMHVDIRGWKVEPVYAKLGEAGYRYARRFSAHFSDTPQASEFDPLIDARAGDFFIGLDLQHYVVTEQVEAHRAMRSKGVDVRFVIYDLLPLQIPQHFPDWLPEMHDRWLNAVTSVDGAYCISKSVADDLIMWLKNSNTVRHSPFKIDWFHLGADIDQSKPSKGMPANARSILSQLGERPTFLSVSTIEPRKGHAQTLSAFESLWEREIDVNLVFVGRKGWNVEELVKKIEKHPENGHRFFWLDEASDEFLSRIYAASHCLIAASEGEGFGLPLIEASQNGLELIVRDIPVFREVAGEHCYYFQNSNEPFTISSAVESWLSVSRNGTPPLSSGIRWLSWRESANSLLDKIINPQTSYSCWNG